MNMRTTKGFQKFSTFKGLDVTKTKVGELGEKIRSVPVSMENRIVSSMKKFNKSNRAIVVAHFPNDPDNCKCGNRVLNEKMKLSILSEREKQVYLSQSTPIECPRVKEKGFKKYQIFCKNCKELVGFIHSKDKYLSDWCNFHYVNTSDGKNWYGALTPNINPKTGELGIECTCGIDTRKPKSEGKDFGRANSKFILKEDT